MVFSSHIFLFYFLPLVLIVYYSVPDKGKNLVLTILSYLFYGWANPFFIFLMLFSTAVDYLCGLKLGKKSGKRTGRDKRVVAVSVITNLILLGFFKYFNFGVESYDALVTVMNLDHLRLDLLYKVILPLGISFYTFQSMSYSIDVYRGDAVPEKSFINFSCFVSMFPQLVAGPVIRYKEISAQLEKRTHTLEKFSRGVCFICLGMAKKVLLANPCGQIADTVFSAPGAALADSWYGVSAYAFQIYFDFSGYTDMAVGLGLMLGFIFPKNFDSPYKSRSLTEFWRRWHISLSTWLRGYLYIPLGGNKKGARRTYINLALVMVLGGLWHGAAWTFVIWGSVHGLLLALERTNDKKPLYGKFPNAVKIAFTFIIILFTWVFFRSDNLDSALNFCAAMTGTGSYSESKSLIGGVIYQPYFLLVFILSAVIIWSCPQTWDFTRKVTWAKIAIVTVLFMLSIIALTVQSYNPFIYFIF